MKRNHSWTLALFLILFVALFIDQLSKLLVFAYLPTGDSYVTLIPGWLGISHVENDAVAFGFGSGNRALMLGVTIATPFIIVGILALMLTVFKRNKPVQVCLSLIASGALGNFIDRLFVRNAEGVAVVRDFVDLTRFGFANCNIADFCITLGAVALVVIILFIGKDALFPLKKSWREEAKREEESKKAKS